MSRFGTCSARIRGDRHTHTHTDTQTHRASTVTLAAHAHRGLITNTVTRLVKVTHMSRFPLVAICHSQQYIIVRFLIYYVERPESYHCVICCSCAAVSSIPAVLSILICAYCIMCACHVLCACSVHSLLIYPECLQYT